MVKFLTLIVPIFVLFLYVWPSLKPMLRPLIKPLFHDIKPYSDVLQAVTPIVIAIFSGLYLKFVKERELNHGDAASIVGAKFLLLPWDTYKILAVHLKFNDSLEGVANLKDKVGRKGVFFRLKTLIILKNYVSPLKLRH